MSDRVSTMIFSTMAPTEIPAVGDVVCYRGEVQPWQVVRRFKVDGSVFLAIQSGDRYEPKVQLEILAWHPQEGDVVLAAAKPYLRWKKMHRDYALPDWFYREMDLISINGAMANVKPKSEAIKSIPLECLRVLKPCLRLKS